MSNPPAIDSNIFVYALNQESKHYKRAKKFITNISKSRFCVTTQNILEIYNVITDSRKFPHPLNPNEAKMVLNSLLDQDNCLLIPPSVDTWKNTLDLASHLEISGKQLIYDCFLAVTLLENQIEILYTANTSDFSKYPLLKAVNPV